tara:strand:+ start:197 stop:382 length:186 start_codon:yes stop_codon:yes gene_type:complete
MTKDLPNWLEAPDKLKAQSFKVLDKAAKAQAKGKDVKEPIDWEAVNREFIKWWKEKGYAYP